MEEYVSVDDVDAVYDDEWWQDKAVSKSRAVLMANVWMTNRGLPDINPRPEIWRRAALELIKDIAIGNVYKQIEHGVTSKSVNAGDVAVSKTFSHNYQQLSASENLALEMLKPWLKSTSVHLLKRI